MMAGGEYPQWVSRLAGKWEAVAATLRHYGDQRGELLLKSLKEELLTTAREDMDVLLSLREAAIESGYHEDSLGRMVKENRIPNRGRTNAPKVRRGDLPKKRRVAKGGQSEDNIERLFRDVIDSKYGA